jgi:hypothetical protein
MAHDHLSIFLDERVPAPDDVLGGSDASEQAAEPLPTPEQLSAEPDIKAALEAAAGLDELVA